MVKKRQHYVSRYYLKAWSNSKEQIYCLRENKIFFSNLMGVAQEKYFYELQNLTEDEVSLINRLAINTSPESMRESHLDFLNKYLLVFNVEKTLKNKIIPIKQKDFDKTMNMMKKNFEEDYHAHIEGIGHKYLDLIKNQNIEFYYNEDSEDRIAFLFFINLQYMRTKKRRNSIINEFKNDNINMRKLWPIMAHIFSTNIALSLHIDKEFKLVLLKNETGIKFITGDQPLINTYGIQDKKLLEHDELEFYYPISPKLAILITKKIKGIKEIDITDSKIIEDYNQMINNLKEEQIFAENKEELEKYIKGQPMDLFTQIVPEDKQHPNFKAVLKDPESGRISIGQKLKEERKLLESWTEGFPNRDNKFVKEFQTTFNTCFWEIYLYKLFNDYNFRFNWDYSSPDFFLNSNGIDFIVEATTANKANDERPNEWEKEELLADILNPEAYKYYQNNMNKANRYSMIRLSNGIFSKYKKYKESYCKLEHVKNKPFVLAIAPFEQPFFYYQYNRPIMALLYDIYVDEEISYKNPKDYPYPPTIYLNSIEKDNGADIPLGFFNDDSMKEISAILFNANALWSKLNSRERNLNFLTKKGIIIEKTKELPEDGLMILHNPYAKYPLDKSIFRKDRVCQVYLNENIEELGEEHLTFVPIEDGRELIIECYDKHMISRNLF